MVISPVDCVIHFLLLLVLSSSTPKNKRPRARSSCSLPYPRSHGLPYHLSCLVQMENIMLESPDEPLVVKLIDFGLSKVFTEGDKMRTACGTVYTMAPEVWFALGLIQTTPRFSTLSWHTPSSS